MQTPYKTVAGSVCGFPKFVTSGSGLGFRLFKNPILGLGSGSGFENIKKLGFGFRFCFGFVKKHRNSSIISLEKLFFLYY
jgi:hypothetical protein